MKLSELLDRITAQIEAEYTDPCERARRLSTMTVEELLTMLSYMEDDE